VAAVKEVILTEAQNGGRVSMAIGDILILRLPENPTTGFRWSFKISDNLIQTNDNFITASTGTGAGGMRCLRFSVQAIGVGCIEATLHRIWETGTAPQAIFNVKIDVP
jgi:inhibitor of cysteine peptidase